MQKQQQQQATRLSKWTSYVYYGTEWSMALLLLFILFQLLFECTCFSQGIVERVTRVS